MFNLIKDSFNNINIEIEDSQIQQLLLYKEYMLKINKQLNLTRITDDEDFIYGHFIDSALILPMLENKEAIKNLVDIGSGGGLPGIVLSILLPNVHVTLLDSQKKKVDFLSDMIEKLELNAVALQMRAEVAGKDVLFREQFDVATARAVAKMGVLSELMLPLVKVGGEMYAYKGPSINEELIDSENKLHLLGGSIATIIPAKIPQRDWEHNIVRIKKVNKSFPKYPRNFVQINKQNLF